MNKGCCTFGLGSCARAVTKLHTDGRCPPPRAKHMLHFSVCARHPCAGSNANLLCAVRVVAATKKGFISVRRGQFPAISQRWELDDSHGDLEDT